MCFPLLLTDTFEGKEYADGVSSFLVSFPMCMPADARLLCAENLQISESSVGRVQCTLSSDLCPVAIHCQSRVL